MEPVSWSKKVRIWLDTTSRNPIAVGNHKPASYFRSETEKKIDHTCLFFLDLKCYYCAVSTLTESHSPSPTHTHTIAYQGLRKSLTWQKWQLYVRYRITIIAENWAWMQKKTAVFTVEAQKEAK